MEQKRGRGRGEKEADHSTKSFDLINVLLFLKKSKEKSNATGEMAEWSKAADC